MKKFLKPMGRLLLTGGLLYGASLLLNQAFDYLGSHRILWPMVALIFLGVLSVSLGEKPPKKTVTSPLLDDTNDYLLGGGMGKVMARQINRAPVPTTRLNDVAGIEEIKTQVTVVVDFLKNSTKYRALGANLPRGILLSGEPGTGKTLLARAIAGESELPFYAASGSEFVELFAGVGASRVRELFARAAKEPNGAIIFIDEIDAIGGERKANPMGSGEREQTLNQLLTEMDGFESTQNILVIAATNRPEILDRALLRPGRFDRKIVVNLPNKKGRRQILDVHTRDVPLAPDVDLSHWAATTVGFSGADLRNLVNEAAIISACEMDVADYTDYTDFKTNYENSPIYPQFVAALERWKGRFTVTNRHFEQAFEIIVAGLPRSQSLTEQERKIVAVHEAGHAVVQIAVNGIEAIEKVTITPTTNGALGYTLNILDSDTVLWTMKDVSRELMVLLAGRAGEAVALNEYSSGAGGDLASAKALSQKAIQNWGLGEKHLNSDEIAIEREAIALIDQAYKSAKRVIRHNRTKFDELVNHLIENDTATREDLRVIFSSR